VSVCDLSVCDVWEAGDVRVFLGLFGPYLQLCTCA
jgi:hypothetical protein